MLGIARNWQELSRVARDHSEERGQAGIEPGRHAGMPGLASGLSHGVA